MKNKLTFYTAIPMVRIGFFLKLKEKLLKLVPIQQLQQGNAAICQAYRKALIHGH